MGNRKVLIGALTITVIFIILLSDLQARRYSILPPEEGLTCGVYGWQDGLAGTLYSAKNPPEPPSEKFSEGWELVDYDPHNFVFGYWHDYWQKVGYHYWARTDVRVEVSQPWHEKLQDIEYYLQTGPDEYVLVKGEVWVYHVDLDFSIVSKPKPDAGIWVFQDIPVWIAFETVVWDRAVRDPNLGVWGKAWGAPLSVYIEGYKVAEGSGDHAVIEPSYVGRFITLYSEPSGLGTTIDDLGVSAGSDVNATLAGDPSPDTRITGEAFAKWRLADFGITTKRDALNTIIEQKFPAVNYKLKVYFLSIGKWTFTKEEKENWDDREADRRLYGWFATWVWMCDSLFQPRF